MIIDNESIILKDGSECILRSPVPEDAEGMLKYLKQASADTEFLLRYPEEVKMTADEEREFIKTVCESADTVMLAAFINGELVGNASLFPAAPYKKTHHRADFGIAIVRPYWALGIGRELITRLIALAPSLGYTQIELDAVEKNTRAVTLYKSLGFTVYGRRENGFKLKDGEECAELLMYRQTEQTGINAAL